MGVHIITKSQSNILLFIFFINVKLDLIFFILEIFNFDFSNIKIFFDNYMLIIDRNMDEPIKPQPIINTLLNIFKYCLHTF